MLNQIKPIRRKSRGRRKKRGRVEGGGGGKHRRWQLKRKVKLVWRRRRKKRSWNFWGGGRFEGGERKEGVGSGHGLTRNMSCRRGATAVQEMGGREGGVRTIEEEGGELPSMHMHFTCLYQKNMSEQNMKYILVRSRAKLKLSLCFLFTLLRPGLHKFSYMVTFGGHFLSQKTDLPKIQ